MVKNILLACVLTAAGGYLLGSILFGVLISKVMYNDDVRNHGSGNAGLTNFYRTFGGLAEPAGSRLRRVSGRHLLHDRPQPPDFLRV